MKRILPSLYTQMRDNQAHGHHKPLVSFKEFCEDVGVSAKVLMGMLTRRGAPKPTMVHPNTSGSWYNKKELYDWWKSINGK